jgi:hypothetical protein
MMSLKDLKQDGISFENQQLATGALKSRGSRIRISTTQKINVMIVGMLSARSTE